MAAATIITSIITGGTNSHQTVAEEINAYATDFVTQGVLGPITLGSGSTAGTGSFAVSQDASPDMGITISGTGSGYSTYSTAYVDCTPSGQDAQVLRARMSSNYTSYTINSNSSGSTKYDWIYLQASAANASVPDLAADNVITLYTSRSSSNSADNGSPPTYGIHLATVTVANGAVSITNANIADARTTAVLSNSGSNSSTGWQTLGYALSYSANNGNKEFQVTTPNNLSGVLSPGMKLSVNRSVSPPTQSMSFVSSSSEYATKASPTGITFTTAFTCEAWIQPLSYTGSQQTIISRDNSSGSGFALALTGSGNIIGYFRNGSGATTFTSNQVVPLSVWTHVAVTVTVSSGASGGTIYINGTSVSLNASGSQTTMVQGGPLQVGAANTGSYFNGYISEARIWSVAQTQANIESNMAISISGAASNLVAYFQGNGNFNDGTSNANNLTATNGATATQASNPYNAVEYAVITAVSYSNPTTTITLQTGAFGTIPNQTLNTPYYSTVKEPYGFPNTLNTDLIIPEFSPLVAANGGVQSYVNSGTAGGTFYYVNLGGIKLLWGQTVNTTGSTGGGSNGAFNFPGTSGNFFNTIQSITLTVGPNNTTNNQSAVIGSGTGTPSTGIQINVYAASTTTAEPVNVFVVGT